MSDSQEENVKRRLRARIIDALATKARQPGEQSRTAVKIAGAIAVLALVAGGALGLGAWRSYQNSDHAENSANSSKKRPSPSSSASSGKSPSPSAGEDSSYSSGGYEGSSSSKDGKSGGKTAAQGPVTPLLPDQEKKQSTKSGEAKKSAKASSKDLSNILLQNAATRKCAGQGVESKNGGSGTVQQQGCDKSSGGRQAWNVSVVQAKKAPEGRDLISIRNSKTGKCMDLRGHGSASKDAGVRQSNCNKSRRDNQLWWVDPQKDGKLLIRNHASNSACLQIGKRKAADKEGLPLHVGSCAVGQKNRWLFAR